MRCRVSRLFNQGEYSGAWGSGKHGDPTFARSGGHGLSHCYGEGGGERLAEQ